MLIAFRPHLSATSVQALDQVSSEASEYSDSLTDLLKDFRGNLSKEDLARIKQSNPSDPRMPVALAIGSNDTKPCTPDDVALILKHVPFEKLFVVIPHIALVEESEYASDIVTQIRVIQELLDKDARFKRFSPLRKVFYSDEVLATATQSTNQPENERVKRAVGIMQSQGVALPDAKGFFKKILSAAPHCLEGLSMELFKQLKVQVTQLRGRYLSENLGKMLHRKKNQIESIATCNSEYCDPKPELIKKLERKGEAVYGLLKDGWDHDFQIGKVGNKLYLVSFGADALPDQKSQGKATDPDNKDLLFEIP